MSHRRLRAAAVLGACAVVLTVGVLPAHAVDTNDPTGTASIPVSQPTASTPDTGGAPSASTPDPGSAPSASTPDTGSATDTSGTTGSDPTDVGGTGSTGSSSSGDTSTSSGDDSSDSGDVLAGDSDSSDSQAGADAGPIVKLDASSITPADLSSNGLKVVASGLTPNSRYQPFARSGSTTVSIGGVQTADVWGWLTFTWRPAQPVATGVRSVGVVGLDGQTDGGDQTLTIKYDSGLSWHPAKRHGDSVKLAVEVDRSSARGRYSPWNGAKVLFQKRSGGKWRTVRTVTASAKGIAKATIVSGMAQWRAKVAETSSVFAVVSSSHRK